MTSSEAKVLLQRARGEANAAWGKIVSRRNWYRHFYLNSPHWKALRQAKFERDGKKCECCGTDKNLQCHHLTYRNIFDVTLDDLQVLCQKCHKKEHRRIKQERKKKRRERKLTKFNLLSLLLEEPLSGV